MKKPKTKKILKATAKNIRLAAKLLKDGGVVAFPTETVYGLGASVFDGKAAARIFEIKKRPRFDPLIVHICEKKQLRLLAQTVPPAAEKLIREFWPGPLTLVLTKKAAVPDIVTAGLNTVAVRMPENKIALKLIKASGTPLAAPSANLFSRLSPTRAGHVYSQLKEGPDLILDGGKTRIGLESTILKYERGTFRLLRAGGLETEKIEKISGRKLLRGKKRGVEAPGQSKKHYSPKAELLIVTGPGKAVRKGKTAYLAFSARPGKKFDYTRVLSPSGDLREAAANLFDFLHGAEARGIKTVYAEKPPLEGLGLAIMDRLKRASHDKK
ncbi:MAG: threonylcarbamoyl-AMP synthase [Elusimicrobia bacterium CG08_land_8_20_14_0_20_51_18]|nr:MAG: threonylcarbamoyl-AMP synthase [Elusimicrobia bacterium CG08_land_8_20_14_0_20_51_18]